MTLSLFLPITKVDKESRTVYGVATSEAVDRSGEIMDYESTKPYFEAWSSGIQKSTGGKSKGNVRAMHGKVAAGKLTDITFDDDEKQITVSAKIVDDAEWNKVLEGVYTGFSQGGRYVKRWPEPGSKGLTRYTAEPSEISLVDLPCLPEATFQIIKADGVETRAFKSVEKRRFDAKDRKKDAKSGAAMPDGSFPIENEEDLHNAIRLAGNAKDPAAARAHIKARAESLGLSADIPSTWKAVMAEELGALPDGAESAAEDIEKGVLKTEVEVESEVEIVESDADKIADAEIEAEIEADPVAKAVASVDALEAALAAAAPDPEAESLVKSLGDVSRLSDILGALRYHIADREYDKTFKDSPVRARLHAWLVDGAGILKDTAKEETDKLVAETKAKKAAEADDIAKAASASVVDEVAKVTAERDGFAKALGDLSERIDPLVKTVGELAKRLSEVEAQPMPAKTAGPGAAAVVVSKEADAAGGVNVAKDIIADADAITKALAAMTEEDRALLLIKAAQKVPMKLSFQHPLNTQSS